MNSWLWPILQLFDAAICELEQEIAEAEAPATPLLPGPSSTAHEPRPE